MSEVINGKRIILGIVLVVIIALPFGWHTIQRLWHHINKPDRIICVQSHLQTTNSYVFINGKPVFMTSVTDVCDKEAPNPNYQQELLKWEGR